ncbi:MAG: beta-N-acetylglucosaminidase, partial [Dysgonomonas mossii]|nr:beta-N-acetylglucosaminidase [Dysgonomonas mossii]
MKYIIYLITSMFIMSACINQKNLNKSPVSLMWEMGRNGIEPGYYENTFYLINHSNDSLRGNWIIYYNQMPAAVKPEPTSPVIVQQISSTYYKIAPSSSYRPLASG